MRRPIHSYPTFICTRAFPKFAGDLDRVDASLLPPCSLVACAMNRAVMDSAEGHREFIAGLTAERPWLQVSKMMRVRWLTAANEAGLSGDKAQVLPIAIAPRRANREYTLVDAAGPITAAAFGREDFLRTSNLRHRGAIIRRFRSFGG
jgi:hypothetical protein